jgi:ankyrin repeat protein
VLAWWFATTTHKHPTHTNTTPHPPHRGTTPLHFAAAAKKDALAVCRLLLALGADPQQPDFHGYMP